MPFYFMTAATVSKKEVTGIEAYRARQPKFGTKELPVVPCAECGIVVTEEIAAVRFNADGLCPTCARRKENPDLELRKFVVEEVESLYSYVTSLVQLTDEERAVIRNFVQPSENDTRTGKGLPENYLIEIIFRVAAGQSYRSVLERFNLECGVTMSWGTLKTSKYITSPELKPIIDRLRTEFKNVVRSVPITNPLSLALRLEKLFIEADAAGNLKDRLAIVKTAWEMFGDTDKEKAGTQINFVQVVNNISQRNLAERSARFSVANGSTNGFTATAG